MEFWISPTSEKAAANTGPQFRPTRRYLEVEIPLGGEASQYVYIMPHSDVDENSTGGADVVAIWDYVFDDFNGGIHDPRVASKLERRWAVFAQALVDGMQEDFSGGALVRMTDPDEGAMKWACVGKVRDVRWATGDSILEDCLPMVQSVLGISAKLGEELSSYGVPTND